VSLPEARSAALPLPVPRSAECTFRERRNSLSPLLNQVNCIPATLPAATLKLPPSAPPSPALFMTVRCTPRPAPLALSRLHQTPSSAPQFSAHRFPAPKACILRQRARSSDPTPAAVPGWLSVRASGGATPLPACISRLPSLRGTAQAPPHTPPHRDTASTTPSVPAPCAGAFRLLPSSDTPARNC